MLPPAYTILVGACLATKLHTFAIITRGSTWGLVWTVCCLQEKEVSKAFGTALACIAFTSYLNPIVPIAGEEDNLIPLAVLMHSWLRH